VVVSLLKTSRAAINAIEGGSLRFDVAACQVVVIPAKGSIFKKVKKRRPGKLRKRGGVKGREAAPRKKEGKVIYSSLPPVSIPDH
jgi:hypothetical protein